MKGKRWFFVLLLVLLLINAAVFLIINYTAYDKFLIDQAIAFIESNYEVELKIGGIEISDRQLKMTNIHVNDNNEQYDISIKQVYVNYNLFKALFSNIRFFKTVESITIIEPYIKLEVNGGGSGSENAEKLSIQERLNNLVLPDISGYFNTLSINSGTLDITYIDDHFILKEVISPVTVDVDNRELSLIKLTAGELLNTSSSDMIAFNSGSVNNSEIVAVQQDNNSQNTFGSETDQSPTQRKITMNAQLKGEQLERLEFEIVSYSPDSLEVFFMDQVDFSVNLTGRIVDNELAFNGRIDDALVTYKGITAFAEKINCHAFANTFTVFTDNLLIDDQRVKAEFILTEYLSSLPSVSGSIAAQSVNIDDYIQQVSGSVDIDIQVTGILVSPDIEFTVSDGSIRLYNEQISDISATAKYYEDHIPITLHNALWQDNQLNGEGSFSQNDGFRFDLLHEGLNFKRAGLYVAADTKLSILYQDRLIIETDWNNMTVTNKHFHLDGVRLTAELEDRNYSIKLKGNRFDAFIEGEFDDKYFTAGLDLQRINLNNVLHAQLPIVRPYPFLSGSVRTVLDDGLFEASTELRMTNIHSGNLEGNVSGEFIFDSKVDSSRVSFNTTGTSYNFEPFEIMLTAYGTSNRMKSELFSINNEVFINFETTLPKNMSKLLISRSETEYPDAKTLVSLHGEEINIQKYLKYTLPYHTANNISGQANFEINYDGNLNGFFFGEKLSLYGIGNFNHDLSFSTVDKEDGHRLMFQSSLSTDNGKTFVEMNGDTKLQQNFDTQMSARIDDYPLSDLPIDEHLEGYLSSMFNFQMTNGSIDSDLEVTVNDLRFKDVIDIDIVDFKAIQKDSILIIESLYYEKENEFTLSANGNLGYNIFHNSIYAGDEEVNVTFSGDLLQLLSKHLGFLEAGRSQSEAKLTFAIREEDLTITKGEFNLTGGELLIAHQIRPMTNLSIAFEIEDNQMNLIKCEGRMGEGIVTIRNEIFNDQKDFELGMLNLGRFFIKTSNGGIAVHIPNIFPQGTVANVSIRGKDDEEAQIIGPFDDILMVAECHLSNVSIIFPPNTENLFKIINIATERRPRRTRTPYPFSIDVMLIAKQQVRYVTYPLNLLVSSDGYLHLLYTDGEWIPADAMLASESGYLDFFGTTFSADYANLFLNYELDDYRLRGYFYKYAADGSLITLSVYNDADVSKDDFLNNLNFSIESDNPEDRTILHVLSKVRYNRRLEDIPRSQQNALLQDEFLQFAGLGLSGAFVDPFISPIENRFRNILRLDYFSINPGFMENIVRTYGYSEAEYELDERDSDIIHFGKNILLNNFSVNMGKFLARDMYLDYEFLVQQPLDVVGADDLLPYHNFTLYYNLPYRMRLAYRFYLKPKEEENSHEIFVRRSFSFW